MLGVIRASIRCRVFQSHIRSSLGEKTLTCEGRGAHVWLVVWAMWVGHRVWIWGNLKEDGWQGSGMPFLLVGGTI